MAKIGNYLFLPELHKKNVKIPYGEHTKNSVFERQLHLLPQEVRFCKKCVMSNQRPRIVFDEENVCGACRWWEEKEHFVDWDLRQKEFIELLNKYRRNDGNFDVIVPCSGGKDSGSIAHKLKYQYGMNPLTVTWAPLVYTDIGFQNMQNMQFSGISSHVFTPNRTLQRKISKLGLILIGNHFEAFGRGQVSYAFHVALDLGIKLIMFGENGELEYGGSLKNKDKCGQPIEDWIELYHKGSNTKEIVQFGYENGYIEKNELNDPSLKYFSPPPADELIKNDVEFHWFGYYNKWMPQENFYYVAEQYGFKTNPEGHSEATYNKYASLDDLTDPFHYYLSYIKFGIGRATSDAAHEIREGHLDRDEAIALVHRYDHIFPNKYFKEFLQYMDMTDQEFWDVINAFREHRPNLWKQSNNGEWKLKYQISY